MIHDILKRNKIARNLRRFEVKSGFGISGGGEGGDIFSFLHVLDHLELFQF